MHLQLNWPAGIPVPIELKEEHEFKLMPDVLQHAITDKTKAMIINYPSNPTGGVMTKEDYEKIVPIIKESGIYVSAMKFMPNSASIRILLHWLNLMK